MDPQRAKQVGETGYQLGLTQFNYAIHKVVRAGCSSRRAIAFSTTSRWERTRAAFVGPLLGTQCLEAVLLVELEIATQHGNLDPNPGRVRDGVGLGHNLTQRTFQLTCGQGVQKQMCAGYPDPANPDAGSWWDVLRKSDTDSASDGNENMWDARIPVDGAG